MTPFQLDGFLPVLPVFSCRVKAGFPSPADDYREEDLDLKTRFVRNPAATYYCYADGDSMQGAGIHWGDLLIVDRSIKPVHGMIVVACIDGEMTVKRFCIRDGRPYLKAENVKFPEIRFLDGQEVRVWGVVLHSLHSQPYA